MAPRRNGVVLNEKKSAWHIRNRGAYVDNMLQYGNVNIRKGENKHGFINCVNAASGAHVESPKMANINQILKRGNY